MRLRLVHGFTQTVRSWETVEARLPRDWDVQAVGVPDGLDFVATADTLGIRGRHATWAGYSLGGRLCLRLALDRPQLVQRLALISASPGIESAAERESRRRTDERLAQDLERDGVDAFLQRWLEQPMFQTLPPAAAQLEVRRRANTVPGIAHQLRALGQAVQEPLWDRLRSLSMPVLILVGAYDRKYIEIAERMARAIGERASLVTLPRSGHAVHLERPEEVADALVSWVAATPMPDASDDEGAA